MKIQNFKLASENHGTELIGDNGRRWDLHNAQFFGVRYEIKSDGSSCIEMKWVPAIDSSGSAWGDPENNARSCTLTFEFVERFSIENASAEKETGTLQLVSKADPDNREFPHRDFWGGKQFALLFEFESGLRIEIGAATVRLSNGSEMKVDPR